MCCAFVIYNIGVYNILYITFIIWYTDEKYFFNFLINIIVIVWTECEIKYKFVITFFGSIISFYHKFHYDLNCSLIVCLHYK
jgi:hypothetical protein